MNLYKNKLKNKLKHFILFKKNTINFAKGEGGYASQSSIISQNKTRHILIQQGNQGRPGSRGAAGERGERGEMGTAGSPGRRGKNGATVSYSLISMNNHMIFRKDVGFEKLGNWVVKKR